MNFSKLFKTAHQIAKNIREAFETYRAAFSAALKAAWAEILSPRVDESDPVGHTRQWAFDRLNALKAAQKNARAAYKANRNANTESAFESAAQAVRTFAGELCSRCGVAGRAIRNLEFWFRTSLKGNLYDADDVIEAC